jgi:2-C-methyl-D-erythritol 4-phosphate cytidylyltransferase
MKQKIIAIVPAAGLGTRFNKSIIKTFADLNDIPLLIHTLKRLHSEESITEIIPALRQQDIEKGLEIVDEYKLNRIKRIVPGGRERQDSIYNAIKVLEETESDSCRDNLILIHDGARPIIPDGTIRKLLKEINGVDGVAPGVPAKDTLKEVSADGIVVSTKKRDNIRAIQTPQVFPYRVIKEAYETAYAEGFYATDDAALVERIGGKIRIIEGSPLNIKVTTMEDLEMVEYILKKKQWSNGEME